MKKVLHLLCAAMLLVSFAACTEKDNENGGDGSYASLIIGKWNVDLITINGNDMTPQNMQLSFSRDGSGVMIHNGVSENNGFSWSFSGNVINVTTHRDEFSFTIDTMSSSFCAFHGSYLVLDQEYHGDIRFMLSKVSGGGGNPDPGDLGIGTPELSYSTSNSITVHAHVTGSVGQYLDQFPNYSCGIVWCPSWDGTPLLGRNNTIVANPDSDGNFEISIAHLQVESEYNIVSWLKLTPTSDPIYSDRRTYSTSNAPGQNDTNWINLISAMPTASSTAFSVTIKAYFDGNPIGIGVVYNTSGDPTLSDNVYNGFDHIDMQTGETDATIQRMQENIDGSRTVAALISDVQPGTTYHVRGYMQFSDGSPTIYTDEQTVTTSAK